MHMSTMATSAGWLPYVNTFFVTIATTLGTGILGLPVKLAETGLWPTILVLTVVLVMQLGVVMMMVELIQRASIAPSQRNGTVSALDVAAAGDDHGTSTPRTHGKSAPVTLYALGSLFLSPKHRTVFNLAAIVHLMSILVSYALAASFAFSKLFSMQSYNLVFIAPVVLLLTAIVLTCGKHIQPIVSALTAVKLLLILVMISVVAVVAANGTVHPTDGWSSILHPFLISTVALGGVVNLMPLMSTRVPQTRAGQSGFAISVCMGLVVCWLLNSCWAYFVLRIVPQTKADAESLGIPVSLEAAAQAGQISTVPIGVIIEENFPAYVWVSVAVSVFISLSISVSYLIMGSGLKHILDGLAVHWSAAALEAGLEGNEAPYLLSASIGLKHNQQQYHEHRSPAQPVRPAAPAPAAKSSAAASSIPQSDQHNFAIGDGEEDNDIGMGLRLQSIPHRATTATGTTSHVLGSSSAATAAAPAPATLSRQPSRRRKRALRTAHILVAWANWFMDLSGIIAVRAYRASLGPLWYIWLKIRRWSVERFPILATERGMKNSLYGAAFGLVLIIALCNPAGFLKALEMFTSLALNLSCGYYVAVMYSAARAGAATSPSDTADIAQADETIDVTPLAQQEVDTDLDVSNNIEVQSVDGAESVVSSGTQSKPASALNSNLAAARAASLGLLSPSRRRSALGFVPFNHQQSRAQLGSAAASGPAWEVPSPLRTFLPAFEVAMFGIAILYDVIEVVASICGWPAAIWFAIGVCDWFWQTQVLQHFVKWRWGAVGDAHYGIVVQHSDGSVAAVAGDGTAAAVSVAVTVARRDHEPQHHHAVTQGYDTLPTVAASPTSVHEKEDEVVRLVHQPDGGSDSPPNDDGVATHRIRGASRSRSSSPVTGEAHAHVHGSHYTDNEQTDDHDHGDGTDVQSIPLPPGAKVHTQEDPFPKIVVWANIAIFECLGVAQWDACKLFPNAGDVKGSGDGAERVVDYTISAYVSSSVLVLLTAVLINEAAAFLSAVSSLRQANALYAKVAAMLSYISILAIFGGATTMTTIGCPASAIAWWAVLVQSASTAAAYLSSVAKEQG